MKENKMGKVRSKIIIVLDTETTTSEKDTSSESLRFLIDEDLNDLGYTTHESIVLEADEMPVPFAFVEWYSGMSKDKIKKAYERWYEEL